MEIRETLLSLLTGLITNSNRCFCSLGSCHRPDIVLSVLLIPSFVIFTPPGEGRCLSPGEGLAQGSLAGKLQSPVTLV